MPKFWVYMCRDDLGLPDQLAHAWWRALSKSAWTGCADFRAQLLRYDAHPYPALRPAADQALMRELLAPGHLMQVIEQLVRQHLLLRRDAAKIEDAILRRLDRTGTWV